MRRTDTSEQLCAVDLASVEQRMGVRIRSDRDIAVADVLADVRPGDALLVPERDAPMPEIVRRVDDVPSSFGAKNGKLSIRTSTWMRAR